MVGLLQEGEIAFSYQTGVVRCAREGGVRQGNSAIGVIEGRGGRGRRSPGHERSGKALLGVGGARLEPHPYKQSERSYRDSADDRSLRLELSRSLRPPICWWTHANSELRGGWSSR